MGGLFCGGFPTPPFPTPVGMLYVAGDPVNLVDPSGECLVAVVIAGAIVLVVAIVNWANFLNKAQEARATNDQI